MAAVVNAERVKYNAAKLTDEQVYLALTRHDLTMRQVADLLDVSPSTIQKIRRGESYLYLFPEIPRTHVRTTGPRCNQCVHDHHGKCSLEFPERNRPGGDTAAARCAAYWHK